MPVFRPAHARGRLRHGGATAVHSFSAGEFVDRDWLGFGALRVLAEESLAPGAALPPQRRANMQILTWVRCGVLAWSDGDGDGGELHGDCVQLLDAGHGLDQVERNPSAEHPVELIRLWLQPQALNTAPRRLEAWFDAAGRDGRWQALAAPDGDDEGALPLRAGAGVHIARLAPGAGTEVELAPGRLAWLHVLHGRAACADRALAAGDALGWRDEPGTWTVDAADVAVDLLLVTLPAAQDSG